MRHGTGRVGKWVGLILASLGGAVIVGFGVKHAVIFYAHVRWPGAEEIYTTYSSTDTMVLFEESAVKKVGRSARLYYADTRIIPTSQTVLVEHGLLPSDLDDSFSPRARRADYGFRVKAHNLYIWSVGPDRTNDGAVIRYDATNGLKSGGDIITVVEF